MGLFDTIRCDYPLPLPEFTEEELSDIDDAQVEKINWSEVEWQTKDLDNMLDIYSIEEDGQIYTQRTNWLDGADGPTAEEGDLEKFEKTAELSFYNIILGKKYDHWFEFKAVIWKGDLKELDLIEYKKEDNSERLGFQKQFEKELGKVTSRSSFYKFYRLLLSKPLEGLRYLLGWLVKLTWKIERWMP